MLSTGDGVKSGFRGAIIGKNAVNEIPADEIIPPIYMKKL